MPHESIPGPWWTAILAVLAGLFTWRIKTAVDGAQLSALKQDVDRLFDRVRLMEAQQNTTNVSIATIATDIKSMHQTLQRLEAKLDGKADK